MENDVRLLNERNRSNSLSKIVFFIALTLYLTMTIYITTTFPRVASLELLIKVGCYTLLVIKILLDNYTARQLVLLFSFGIVAILAAMQSDYTNLLLVAMFIIGARNINFYEINRVYFIIGITIILSAMIASKVGLITNLVYYRGTVERQSFGIIYPTDFAAHIFYLILSYCFLIQRQLNKFEVVIFIFIAFFINKYCDARLDVVLVALTIIFFYFLMFPLIKKAIHNIVNRIAIILPTVLFTLSIFLSYFYKPTGITEWINESLSGRLSLGNRAFSMYPVKLFGQFIETNGFGGEDGNNLAASADRSFYFYIDSSYVFMLLRYGILFTLIILILITVKTKKTNSIIYHLAIILALGSAFVDQTLVNPAYNIFILSLLAVIPNFNNDYDG